MEFDCTKEGKNIYFACREKAAKYNDLLNSRERAAELLGISTSTLANHELGVTKNVPPDTVVMMSDLYKTPELRSYYCKHECPIGRNLPLATQVSGLQGIINTILTGILDQFSLVLFLQFHQLRIALCLVFGFFLKHIRCEFCFFGITS